MYRNDVPHMEGCSNWLRQIEYKLRKHEKELREQERKDGIQAQFTGLDDDQLIEAVRNAEWDAGEKYLPYADAKEVFELGRDVIRSRNLINTWLDYCRLNRS